MSSRSDFLDQMAASSRERLARAKRDCSEAVLLERALSSPLPPLLRPHPAGFDLIAELKLRSPAVGPLRGTHPAADDITERVRAYARAGAVAVSVLTEPSRFDGSLEHLQIAARSLAPLGVPTMRKDFIVDPYQVIEARLAGAGGVLIILRMLDRELLGALIDCARRLGLWMLLEAFDEPDIEVMHTTIDTHGLATSSGHPAQPTVLGGLNCRNLATLQIVPHRLEELAHLLPANVPRVAESGVLSAEDAGRIAAAGYQYALVGSALMQDAEANALASAMLQAGRARVPS